MSNPPSAFDDSFLTWLRDETERTWGACDEPSFEEMESAGFSGLTWARGTRWSGGLSEAEIDAAEARWSLRFPPDYRLFLRMLHVPDRRMVGRGYRGSGGVPITGSDFYDWRSEDEAIRDALAAPFEGLVFDVEHDVFWLREWGVRPSHESDRRAIVRAAVDAAPRLIPIFGHRYLVAEPCRAGNAVLSVHQSDVIVYGRNLRDYLVRELLGESGTRELERVPDIPFWGPFCSGDVFFDRE